LIHELEPVAETGVGGVYDLRQHLNDVVLPLPRKRRIFERDISAAKVNAGATTWRPPSNRWTAKR
jgi:hypothetical protein